MTFVTPKLESDWWTPGAEAASVTERLLRQDVRPARSRQRLSAPGNYAAFPDLLTFHDAPTVIEQKLFVMFLEHRMRAFQGTFHASPAYALWYGWSEMQRDLTEIKELAAQMRSKDRPIGLSEVGCSPGSLMRST